MNFQKKHCVISTPKKTDLLFLLSNKQLVLTKAEKIPEWHEVAGDILDENCEYYCFAEYNNQRCLLAVPSKPITNTYEVVTLRQVWGVLSDEMFSLASLAQHLNHWRQTHRFCGLCGSKNIDKFDERVEQCLICSACGYVVHPRISPCVIVLIHDKNRVLLARSAHFPKGLYSLVAGFVEPGETLENALMREVMEEVGVSVKNITYCGSQPWPFPESLMIGFMAEYAEGDIKIDPFEIEDAQWFYIDNLPILSSKASISRYLIDTYLSMRNNEKMSEKY